MVDRVLSTLQTISQQLLKAVNKSQVGNERLCLELAIKSFEQSAFLDFFSFLEFKILMPILYHSKKRKLSWNYHLLLFVVTRCSFLLVVNLCIIRCPSLYPRIYSFLFVVPHVNIFCAGLPLNPRALSS